MTGSTGALGATRLKHGLTHVEMRTPQGPRLTPACICGWYSPNSEHAEFERHMRRVADQFLDDHIKIIHVNGRES